MSKKSYIHPHTRRKTNIWNLVVNTDIQTHTLIQMIVTYMHRGANTMKESAKLNANTMGG